MAATHAPAATSRGTVWALMYGVLACKRDPVPAVRIPWKATSCRFSPSLDPAASPVDVAPAAHDGRPRLPVFRTPCVPCYTRADGPSKIEKPLCLARRQILRRKSMYILGSPLRQALIIAASSYPERKNRVGLRVHKIDIHNIFNDLVHKALL